MLSYSNYCVALEELADLILLDIESVFTERKERVTDYKKFVTAKPLNPAEYDDKDVFRQRILDELSSKADDIQKGLKHFHRILTRESPSSAKILTDIKRPEKVAEKIIERGKSKITDVIRGAILLKTDADVEKVVKNIKRNVPIYEYEYKKKGEDKNYGYHGSHHFLIQVDVGYLAEIQVMTKRLWAFKHEAHKIYEKLRVSKDIVKDYAEKLKKHASVILSKKSSYDDIARHYVDQMKKHSRELFIKGNIPRR